MYADFQLITDYRLPTTVRSGGLQQVAVVLQRPAVVCEDEGKLAVVKGGIAPMDRHVMARAQEHYVLNPVLAALADLACDLRQHDLARLQCGLVRRKRRKALRDQIDIDEIRKPGLLGRILLGEGSLAGPVRAGNDDNPGSFGCPAHVRLLGLEVVLETVSLDRSARE
jgi:hypothetical protein